MVLAPIILMVFLWKPIDFIKSVSLRKSLSSISGALAKSNNEEIVKAVKKWLSVESGETERNIKSSLT